MPNMPNMPGRPEIKAALQLSWTWPVVQLEERQHQIFPQYWQTTSSNS
jgi:hypothetical protein